jgi:hypothetical protein
MKENKMEKCCNNPKMMCVSAKCSDQFNCEYPNGTEHEGCVPDNIGIGSDDYVEFEYCVNCGKIQGEFPLDI